ncbi:uncharacterized protein LOC100907915 [Galendromus occidentalis]|uniref:Uncharacterized protein LOC100907915 n=1 Tax=Galendromus occidentalis TaxID=34638 RepID=A0AAJ7WHY5_9ACAR|nr:uncharacterized protein LOC100907915 [Galendromus occidentalis]
MELPAVRSTKAIRYLCLLLLWHSFASSTNVAAAFEDDELTASMTALASGPSDESTMDDPSNVSDDKSYSYSNYFDDEEPRVMVIGVLGGRVGLPCNIQPNSTEDEVSLVLWYKDDSTTPIYSLDSRKTTLRNAHHSPVYWLNGRAYLKTAAAAAATTAAGISSGLGFKRTNDDVLSEASANTPTSLLELRDLEKQDEALYRCRVDFKRARTRNYEVQLKVIVPPRTMTVTDQRGTLLQNNAVIGPYSGGDKLVLKCQAHGGNPSSTVGWYRGAIVPQTQPKSPENPQDFSTLRSGMEFLQSAEHESDLVFPSLGHENLLVTFTCVVSNNNISQPLTSSVTLDIYFRPSRVWISTEASSVLSAGAAVTFHCSSSGSRPPAVIQWFKGGERLSSTSLQNSSSSGSNNSSIGTWHTSTIELIPRPEDDGKQLTCRADNPAMPPSINHDYHGRHGNAITDGITLEVQYVPQLVVRLGKKLRHSHIREGSDVILECDVRTNPQLIEMGWKYEGTELITDTSRGIVISELSLVLQNVTRHNRGHYVCTGTNAEGTGESEPFHLRVRYEPICKPGLKQVYGAARNEPVRISCELEADPEEVTIKWKTKKMKYGISAQNFVTSPAQSTNGFSVVEEDAAVAAAARDTSYFVETEGTRSWLTIVPKSEDDYGPVICWGKNQMGRQKDPCVFTLIAAGPPGPVHNCSVINQTEESLTISCLEGYDGGSEGGQMFHMEVHDSANQNRVLIANLSSSSTPPSLQATGLSPSTPYVCTIYASNERGTSQPTILVASTIPRPLSLSSKGGFIFDYIDGRLSLNNSPALIAFAITAALSSLALGTFLVVILIRRTSGFGHNMFKKNESKDSHTDAEKDDDDPSIPLRESNKDQTGITDFRSFSDNEEDKKCPDILSETQIISSPVKTAAESSFIRRSPSCNSQLFKPDGGTSSSTNSRLKRDSWDFSNHKPRNSLPSSLSFQHMATIPIKCQGQQNASSATGSGLKTPSIKTVTFDITPSTHPYRAKVLKCPLSLPATTSVQALGGPSCQQQTTTTTLVHPKNKAPLANRDEGHL